MRMKKSLLVVGLAIVAAVGVAAQPTIGGRAGRGPQGSPRGGPGGGPRGGPGGAPFERVLQLTEEQREAVQALREKEGEAAKPLAEQMGPLHEKLRQALESGAPAATVGQLVIDAHALQQQVQEIHKSFREQLVALLTPEQQEKLKTLESLMGPGRGRGPGGPGFGGFGGPGFGGPPPFARPQQPRN